MELELCTNVLSIVCLDYFYQPCTFYLNVFLVASRVSRGFAMRTAQIAFRMSIVALIYFPISQSLGEMFAGSKTHKVGSPQIAKLMH